jgi:hypothetical protein
MNEENKMVKYTKEELINVWKTNPSYLEEQVKYNGVHLVDDNGKYLTRLILDTDGEIKVIGYPLIRDIK